MCARRVLASVSTELTEDMVVPGFEPKASRVQNRCDTATLHSLLDVFVSVIVRCSFRDYSALVMLFGAAPSVTEFQGGIRHALAQRYLV